MQVDQPPTVIGTGPGGVVGPPTIMPVGGEYGYDYGYPDIGAGTVLPPPLLTPIDEGPLAMQAGVGILGECDPEFNALLPMEYPDQYGAMTVLQVVCAQQGGSAGQPIGERGDDRLLRFLGRGGHRFARDRVAHDTVADGERDDPARQVHITGGDQKVLRKESALPLLQRHRLAGEDLVRAVRQEIPERVAS